MRYFHIVFLFFFISAEVAFSQTKKKTPIEGLLSIPLPPTTIEEVLQRCPKDQDTLVHSLAEDLDYYIEEKRWEISESGNGPRGPDLMGWKPLSKELKERQLRAQEKLRVEIQKNEKDVPRLFAKIADTSAHKLLNAVKVIGEELDMNIKRCLTNTISGYDTVCVESAEMSAQIKRRQASLEFLHAVNQDWSGLIDSLKTIITTRLKLAQHVHSASEKQNLEMWKIVLRVLQTEEQITKLAVQFCR